MSSESSNPFAFGYLSEEDAASIAALQAKAARCKAQGFYELTWQYSARASQIINRATLKKLGAGDYAPDQELFYCDIPDEYPKDDNKGVTLNITLIAGSPLFLRIMTVLQKDCDGSGII